jgi:signal peptidase
MSPARSALRDAAEAVLAVALLAAVLVAVTGAWPPLVAVESGSMEPNLHRGDIVVVTDPGRFPGANATGGVVPARAAGNYSRLGGPGDVVVFDPPGWDRSPVIHRVRFHVAAGENWYDRADPAYVGGADDCASLPNCPAPHAGFVTRGDANDRYDQVAGRSPPVRPAWVEAKAQVHAPWLGWIRLLAETLAGGG